MRHAVHKDRERGFTIIEMLIVMALFGVILGFVLLAIPALQRNARNSERKQDVGTVLSAISNYSLNNSARFPTDTQLFTASPSLRGLVFYEDADIRMVDQQAKAATNTLPANIGPINPADSEEAHVYNYVRCNNTTQGQGNTAGADYRDIAVFYALQTSGGYAPQCQQL